MNTYELNTSLSQYELGELYAFKCKHPYLARTDNISDYLSKYGKFLNQCGNISEDRNVSGLVVDKQDVKYFDNHFYRLVVMFNSDNGPCTILYHAEAPTKQTKGNGGTAGLTKEGGNGTAGLYKGSEFGGTAGLTK